MNKTTKTATQPVERRGIRRLMLFYDSVIYTLLYSLILLIHPQVDKMAAWVLLLHMLIGYICFFGFRFIFRSYHRILRVGTFSAFSREVLAGALGAVLSVAFSYLVGLISSELHLPLTLSIAIAAIYVLVSLFVRAFYVYIFRFTEGDGRLARMLRSVLSVVAFVDFSSKEPGATLHIELTSAKRSVSPINELQRIAESFAIRGEITSITQINKGYINRTYRVETISDSGNVHKYTLQRINTNVFPDPDALMENFKLTTDHLFGRLRLSGQRKRGSVQTLRFTKDGCSYLKDPSGCWRMLSYFDDVYSVDIPKDKQTFYHSGVAFGSFMKEMTDVDCEDVNIVIPNFHNTKSRYNDLEAAIAKDPKGRVKSVTEEIEFVRARSDRFGIISDALDEGVIPTRVCHNDCNLNNILFDNETDLPVAIIDLDTVMPSSPLYDYGDSMRIGTNTATDDEKDLSLVSCDLELYEAYARGYLEACGDVLTSEELRLLPYASIIITVEDGIRFLMDHINGDTYYNIYYPGQNLDRARTQLKLVEDMERKLPEIKRILRELYRELSLDGEIE